MDLEDTHTYSIVALSESDTRTSSETALDVVAVVILASRRSARIDFDARCPSARARLRTAVAAGGASAGHDSGSKSRNYHDCDDTSKIARRPSSSSARLGASFDHEASPGFRAPPSSATSPSRLSIFTLPP